jgi:AcrR family transcriptional regulator
MALSSQDAGPSAPPPLPGAPRRVTRRKTAGRPPTLSAGAIVAAAIEVIDEGGVSGLSMRRVADQLGVGVASLYAHVSGKDELLELVYDELVGQVPLEEPDPARWREQVHQMLRGLRDILTEHADAALAGLGRIPTSPQTLTAAEALVAVLKAGGLTDQVIALGFDQLILYVSACAFEASLYTRNRADPKELERYFAEAHTFYATMPPDRFPVLTSLAPFMFDHGEDERFEFGLDVLIAGMEAASAAERAGQLPRGGDFEAPGMTGGGVGQGHPYALAHAISEGDDDRERGRIDQVI